jgi:hypothetical protein
LIAFELQRIQSLVGRAAAIRFDQIDLPASVNADSNRIQHGRLRPSSLNVETDENNQTNQHNLAVQS